MAKKDKTEKQKETKEGMITEEKETKKEKELTIESLPGVGAASAEKLREAGFSDLMGIAVATPGEIVDVAGLTEATARKAINFARNKLDMGFESGDELLKKRALVEKIITGSKSFDDLLAGGFETGAITECFGAYGSGKTQLAHVLSVNVIKQSPDAAVVYIDTENTFRPERIQQIAKASNVDQEKALKQIHVARAFNSDHQMLLAEKIDDLIKQGLKIKLIIVDSLTAHFRAEFVGRGTLADRQQKLNKHMHTLMRLATVNNLCVYVTNQVMAKPDMFFGDPTEAIGGNIVAHNCLTADTLIQLGNGDIKPIGDAYEAEDVISVNLKTNLKNSRKKCEVFAVKTGADKVCEIMTTTSRIKTSPEHRFFRLNEFEIVEARAKELKEGDYVMQSRKIGSSGEIQKLPSIGTDKMITINNSGAEFIKEELKNKGMRRTDICEKLQITQRQLRRVLNQGCSTNTNNLNLLMQQGINMQSVLQSVKPFFSYKHKQIVIPEYLTEKVAQIMGYVYGDGSLGERGIRMRDKRMGVLQEYQKLFKAVFNAEGRISKVKDKSCYQLEINSKAISSLFKRLENKTLNLISLSCNEQVKSFIRGFFDAEGSVGKKRVCASMSQRDERTLQYIQLLLLRFGIRSKLRGYIHNGNPINHLDILDKESYLKFAEDVGATAKDKKELMGGWSAHLRNTRSKETLPISRKAAWNFIKECGLFPSKVIRSRPATYKYITMTEATNIVKNLKEKTLTREQAEKLNFLKNMLSSDIRWEKIKRIKEKENKEPLYDLSIAENENFMANGFIVHNSTFRIYLRRGRKGSRVAKLVDSPSLPDGEAVFFVDTDGVKDVK